MDTFLVIVGILLVTMIAAIIVINKLNLNVKIKGVDLKYWLTGGAIIVGVITLIVLKIVLGNKSRTIDELLAKLRKVKTDSDLKAIDEKIKVNGEKVEKIDSEINELKNDYESNKDKINQLESSKSDIDKQLEDLNNQYNEKVNESSSLDDALARMKNRLN